MQPRGVVNPSAAGAVLRTVARGALILLLSGLLGASLVRLAPGFGMDEGALDARYSAASRQALNRERERTRQIGAIAFYYAYVAGLARGEMGRSALFDRPVRDLISERAPRTVRSVFSGLAMGWLTALVLAALAAAGRRTAATLVAALLSSSLLSIPSAVVASVCLLLGLPPAAAIAAVVLPQVFSHATEQIRAASGGAHVIMARARGLRAARVFVFYVAPATFAPLLAVLGVSVTLAFGAAIPVEALADSPGLGQLAWQAALGRDLPLLVSITLLLTAVTVLANSMAEILATGVQPTS
ncbi:MAG TPA: ABC transporter permease subunit [Bryobacteraceae bacterium]|nr:ABC transporter permease subunit [Bryobacteraceae bacterium]